MGFPKITFRVCENKHCPLFKYGDTFTVSGIAVFMDSESESSFINTTVIKANQQRENCKTLNADLTKIIIEYERADQVPDCLITCSGCTGSIRLEHAHDLVLFDDASSQNIEDVDSIVQTMENFPFFRKIDPKNLHDIIKISTLQQFNKDEIILRKGDPASNLYIIVKGCVDVLNETGIPISELGQGEVFGETSLICDDNIGATIQATERTEVLCINQNNFKKLLNNYPTLHLYFTRLLAERLNKSNQVRTDDLASGMIGNLEEIPPEALFQTLNVNTKTGILTITQLSKGTARFSLRQGGLIKASYAGQKGKDAFYAILGEKEGRFKFTPGLPPEDFDAPELGYFMKLLMEGMQIIDEQTAPKNIGDQPT